MRVAYVLKKFPRISETFILHEILELERQGVEVVIFSLHRPDDGAFHEKLAKLGRPVRYVPKPTSQELPQALREFRAGRSLKREGFWDFFEETLAAERPDLWEILGWSLEIARVASEIGVDRFHAHFATIATWVAHGAARLSGIPYTFTCHAKDIYRTGVDAEAFSMLAQAADFVVTVCDANAEYLRSTLKLGESIDLQRLYNGVDIIEFHPRFRRPDPVPLILGVGRLVEKKGFRYLIEAVAGLIREGQSLRCVIVGEGEERPVLEQMIAAAAVENIELLGLASHGEVRAYLSRAACVVLPCVVGEDGNRDALPTVLLEALASGIPVISTPVAGVEEIVDGGKAGVLVPMHDAPALQAGIRRLLEHPRQADDMARWGRDRAEACFDLRANVRSLRERWALSPAREFSA